MESKEASLWRLCLVTVVAWVGIEWLGRPSQLGPSPLLLDEIPRELGDWLGEDVGSFPAEIKLLPKDVTIWRRSYSKPGFPVPVVISVAITGKRPSAALHQPEVCFRGQGWEPVNRRILEFRVPGYARNPVRVSQVDLDSEGKKALAYYWFQSCDVVSAERVLFFWSGARKRIMDGRTERWALVRVMADEGEGVEREMAALMDLLWPYLLKRWMG